MSDVYQELAALRDENAKLRDIEGQFWMLLQEREDLQRQLNELHRTETQKAIKSREEPADTRKSGIREVDYERMSAALQECMTLLLQREFPSGGQSSSHGGNVVLRFLDYCDKEAQSASVASMVRAARDEVFHVEGLRAPAPASVARSSPDNQMLVNEVNRLRLELTQLQDELDRTDASRLQALEDVERLQKQVMILTGNMNDLRSSFASVKSQAEHHSKIAATVTHLKVQLSERESELAQLKGTLAQLQRLSSVGGAQLAADAARIRSELNARMKSEATL